jgi:hypothetical protein
VLANAQIVRYVNKHLVINGTLPGSHVYDALTHGLHLGYFAIYDYASDATGNTSTVSTHADTDFQGRCLSVALHLDNAPRPDHSPNLQTEGAVFETAECTTDAPLSCDKCCAALDPARPPDRV